MSNTGDIIYLFNAIVKSFDIAFLWVIFIIVTHSQGTYAVIYTIFFWLIRFLYEMYNLREII